jgi:hypothetical protein
MNMAGSASTNGALRARHLVGIGVAKRWMDWT